MTVTSTSTRTEALGDGSTTTFPYLFKVFSETELRVIVRDADTDVETVKTLGTHYSVTGAGSQNGGNVEFVTPPDSGDIVVIRRVPPLTQTTRFRGQGTFHASSHEDALDKQAHGLQYVAEEGKRAIKLAPSLDPDDFDMELPATMTPGRVVGVNEDGDGFDLFALDASADVALPAAGRTTDTLTELLANNVRLNLRDYLDDARVAGTTNDTDAVHAWIAAANAAKPCVAYAPDDTYLLDAFENGALAIPTIEEGVTVLGDGYNTVFKVRAASVTADGDYRIAYYQSGVTFRNLRVHGNRDGIFAGTPTLADVNFIAFARKEDGLSDLDFDTLWIHDIIGIGNESFGIHLGSGVNTVRIRRIRGWHNQGTPVSIAGKIETTGDPFSGDNLAENVELDDVVAWDNDWAGVTVYGARNVRCRGVHTYDNVQGGFNAEWCEEVDVYDLVSHENGYAGVTLYGGASVRLHNPTLYENGTAGSNHGELRLLASEYFEGAPKPLANVTRLEIHGGSVTPVSGGRHLYYEADGDVNTGVSIPESIVLDLPGAEDWTIQTAAGSDRPCPTIQYPAVRTARPVPTGKLAALAMSGSISSAAFAGSGNLSANAVTLTATAQFANGTTGYVLKPGRKYLVRTRVMPDDATEWRLRHITSGNVAPQTLVLPFDAQDVDEWFTIEAVFTTTTAATRFQFIVNGSVASSSILHIDYLEVYEIVGRYAASEQADPVLAAVSADRGDASVTLVAGTDEPTQRFATTLTANRTVTLSSTGVYNGAKFTVVRTGLGAFTLDVGGLKTIPSGTAAFVDVKHDGTAWRLVRYGTL